MRSRLIHPVDIEIRNIDTTNSVFDTAFEEATTIEYEDSFVVKGQVKAYSHMVTTAGGNGFERIGDGYVLLKTADAEEVNMNAEIVSIDGSPCGYRVIEKRPCVHYGTSEMMKVFYKAAGKSVETR